MKIVKQFLMTTGEDGVVITIPISKKGLNLKHRENIKAFRPRQDRPDPRQGQFR
jgi:hypothetical protein